MIMLWRLCSPLLKESIKKVPTQPLFYAVQILLTKRKIRLNFFDQKCGLYRMFRHRWSNILLIRVLGTVSILRNTCYSPNVRVKASTESCHLPFSMT